MRPGEVIQFMLMGGAILIVIFVIWIILRNRKKLAIALTVTLIISYISYYFLFSTIQEHTHAKRYEQINTYLSETYPEKNLVIYPQNFEPGIDVGDFMVHEKETPKIGVNLRVKRDGSIVQISTWSGGDYPTQKELWMVLQNSSLVEYSLDTGVPDIVKKDTWIERDLTVFALIIDNKPAIAIFTYSSGGYGLIKVEEREPGEIVTAEYEDYLFAYVDEGYAEKTATIKSQSGKTYSINVLEQEEKLFVYK